MNHDFPVPIESLISMVEEHAVLWDKSLENYKNKEATRESWHDILEKVYPQSTTWDLKKRQKYAKKIVTKWTYIRDSYLRSERKIESQRKVGKLTRITRPYLYHKQLRFLKKNARFNTRSSIIDEVYLRDEKNDSSNEDSSHESVESMNQRTSIKIEDDDEAQMIEILEPHSQSRQAHVVDIQQPHPQPVLPMRQPTPVRKSAAEITPMDGSMINLMAFSSQASAINRHVSFFNGLLPTLDKFDDDQVIEFQLGVLNVMKDVKNKTI